MLEVPTELLLHKLIANTFTMIGKTNNEIYTKNIFQFPLPVKQITKALSDCHNTYPGVANLSTLGFVDL